MGVVSDTACRDVGSTLLMRVHGYDLMEVMSISYGV